MINLNHSNDTKDQINLNGQLNMNVSIVFYVIQWFLLFPTVYVNILVYRMAKKEDLWEIEVEGGYISNRHAKD